MYGTIPRSLAIAGWLLSTLLSLHTAQASEALELANAPAPTGTVLTLTDVSERALKFHPLIQAKSHAAEAQAAAAEQAAIFPNPVLSWSRQNLNNDQLTGTDGQADTVQLSQLIELGGKRSARQQSAERVSDIRQLELTQVKADVLALARERFAGLQAAQERAVLAMELAKLAEQTHHAASERVRAGKVAPMEQSKAHIVWATAKSEWLQAERERRNAAQQLAALWGGAVESLQVEKRHEHKRELPTLESLLNNLADSPRWQQSVAQIEERQAQLDLANVKAIPDLTLSVGRTDFADLGEQSDHIGISLQIPLFDRNQGGKAEARARLSESHASQQELQWSLRAQLQDSHQRLVAIDLELQTLEREILPAANDVHSAAQAAYHAGKVGLLEVLDAQRMLFSARQQQVIAQYQFQQNLAELERLVGTRLPVSTQP